MDKAAIESILAVDIGELTTRVILFELVDTQFTAVARGEAPTTAAPQGDGIIAGVLDALRDVENAAGKKFLTPPTAGPAAVNPVDAVMVTLTAGPDIRTLCLSLTTELSLESAVRLAGSTDTRVIAALSQADGSIKSEQLDAILHAAAELVIISGGTETGRINQSGDQLSSLRAALALLPRDQRPTIFYAGSSALEEKTRHTIGPQAPLIISSNILPQVEQEALDPARGELMEAAARMRLKRVMGAAALVEQSGGKAALSSTGFGRMVRYLGSAYHPASGVLGIDLGISHLTLACAGGGQLWQGRYPYLPAEKAAAGDSLKHVLDWLAEPVDPEQAVEYWLRQDIAPGDKPGSLAEAVVDLALARWRVQYAARQFQVMYPQLRLTGETGLLSGWEPIILSGEWAAGRLNPAQAALLLLDGLQPTGITNLVLDHRNWLSLLGACGQAAPQLPVHLLEAGLLQHLCTVITPICQRADQADWLELTLTPETGDEIQMTIRGGELVRLALPEGQSARLTLIPAPRVLLGRPLNQGRLTLKVTGSQLGLVIDTRGRPISIPAAGPERQQLISGWRNTLTL
jgi:hypothetical protein